METIKTSKIWSKPDKMVPYKLHSVIQVYKEAGLMKLISWNLRSTEYLDYIAEACLYVVIFLHQFKFWYFSYFIGCCIPFLVHSLSLVAASETFHHHEVEKCSYYLYLHIFSLDWLRKGDYAASGIITTTDICLYQRKVLQ